ncbi:SRPBCC family protein [Chthonobacter rhizosphaerae]|uniref:SRPBCC family protein n=1 Tax=Chthonobacter rhizosphaerae TaxID=2735553 RepID=UPI0015EE4FFF|nr:carbon monoxide dehydrogenase subunit G [Chthonobacter rhizosphaerae]
MDMTGEYRIPAPRQAVWEALNDPDMLKACIPGCESLEKTGDEMVATVVAKIGPVKAKFSGKVRLENLNPPTSYSIVGEGSGGVAGFAKGGADVSLADDGADTVLSYTAKAQVGGKLAQLGSRLIDGTAKMMADQFFSAFSAKVGAAAAAATPVAVVADTPAPATMAATTTGAAPASAPMSPAERDGGQVAVKEDALDRVVHAAEAAERKAETRVETAAIKSGPSGPMLWGLIALAVLAVILIIGAL